MPVLDRARPHEVHASVELWVGTIAAPARYRCSPSTWTQRTGTDFAGRTATMRRSAVTAGSALLVPKGLAGEDEDVVVGLERHLAPVDGVGVAQAGDQFGDIRRRGVHSPR